MDDTPNEVQQSHAGHWQALAGHMPLGLISDLDGTLLPFTADPEESQLGPQLAALLDELSSLPGAQLIIVSGRLRDQLARLMAPVPGAWLMAEHGAWRKRDGDWESTAVDFQLGDIAPLAGTLQQLADEVEGALVEHKTWSVTFHYRQVPETEREALQVHVDAILESWLAENPGYERLEGVEVVEVRPERIRKSLAVPWVRGLLGPEARLLALGDDLTDEDLFQEMGVSDEAVLVGPVRHSRARWHLENPAAVVEFLSWLIATRRSETAATGPLPEPLITKTIKRLQDSRERHALLVVSNRLPNVARVGPAAKPGRKQNVGGLVSALMPAIETHRGLWLGWSGRTIPDRGPSEVELDQATTPALASIDFPSVWYHNYYNGFCNRTLWPLFHTFPQHVIFADEDWECYRQVNRAFARAALNLVGPDTPVWLHDYHLLMAAQSLREFGHVGPVGLFLHTPFPGPDLFGLLPWAEQLLEAILDLDLIGFHTDRDVDNFRQTVSALSPAHVSDGFIEYRGRRVQVGAFPIGIFPEPFREPADPEVAEDAERLLAAIAPGRLILGVDRLDYTKGIPERLQAFGELLRNYPQWRRAVSLIQISVPSREDVPEYIEQRRLIENIVGRINGEYGEATWVPVRYLYRSYSPDQLAELYRAADVGYVTPLRDGMNLVAKEYVAAQNPDDPGVLLLSRFAGAAFELKDAVLTNPWHTEGVARDLDRALRMDLIERQERHRRLLETVTGNTATDWADRFLRALTGAG